MKMNSGIRNGALLALVSLSILSAGAASLPARQGVASGEPVVVEVVQTNWTPRYVTNLIEVRAPLNAFVTEYHTNLIQRSVTNTVVLDVFRTNFVTRYETNWVTRTLTNLNVLSLTNWETVVVTRTNWIRQPMTNVIEMNVPVAAAAPPVQSEPPPVSTPKVVASGSLALQVVRTARPVQGSQVELSFRLQLAEDAAAALQVQQWRVEREDGAVFFFPQEQEFKRTLPVGRYQISAKARRGPESPVLNLKSSLDVTRDAVARR